VSDLGAAARGEAELTKRSEASQLATAATRSLQPPSCPPAEHDSEDAQRHTDGAESKWRMVLEMEADVQTFDEQISEIHTAEHRAATISTTEIVHGRVREPPRQTWRVAVDEGRLRVLVLGVLAIVMVAANCERKQLKAVPGIVRLQHTARTYPSIQA
jgi:hypothetical protein